MFQLVWFLLFFLDCHHKLLVICFPFHFVSFGFGSVLVLFAAQSFLHFFFTEWGDPRSLKKCALEIALLFHGPSKSIDILGNGLTQHFWPRKTASD